MSMDKKVETVMTFMTALQSGDLELAARVSSIDLVVSGLLTRPLGQSEFLALQGELLTAMPDFSYNLTDVKRSGEDVQALISISGTQTNDLSLPMVGLQPIQATGLTIDLPQTRVIYQVEEGHVLAMEIERVVGGGLSGLLQQIGAELPLLERERVREDPSDPPESSNPPDIDQS
jgi:hypothetical protein